MKKTNQYIVLHPFFVAAYPILFLLSSNISQINPEQALRPLAISLSVSLILTLVFGLAARDLRQGGLSASLLLGLFFLYGHVQRLLEGTHSFLSSNAFLLTIWLVLLFAGLLAKYKIRDIGAVNRSLNIVTFVLLLMPIINIGLFVSRSGVPQAIKPSSPIENMRPVPQADSEYPDIYYIILDAYGRSDVVKEVFGYDNSSFIAYLEEKGFYVAGQSRSNYIQTALSISSSLNFDYLGALEGATVQSEDRDPLAELIHHSELRNFLEANGYKTVAFATGYAPTSITDADVYFDYRPMLVNDLEGLILETSIIRALGDKMLNLFIPFFCDAQRDGIQNIFIVSLRQTM